MCKISIIIPCYNVAEILIQRCMSSIDAQTFRDYEVILIDDGSESTYSNYLVEIKRKYNKVEVYHQDNKGVSAARNYGIKLAQGDYIVFVDADDYLVPRYLEEALKVAEQNKADIVVGLNSTTFSTEICGMKEMPEKNINVYSDGDIEQLKGWMLGKVHNYGDNAYLGQGPWNRMVCSRLVQDTPFDESLPIGEDIVWNLKLLHKAKKVCLVDCVWYVYYVSSGSSSRKYRENAIDESYRSLIEIRNNLNMNDDEQYLSYCFRCWSDLKRIFRCYLSYNKKVDHRQEEILYKNEPWNELGNNRFVEVCGRNGRFMRMLYKGQLLFTYYRLKSFLCRGNIDN